LADIDEYLKGILSQILTSHKILTELDDEPNDLETIKKEKALNHLPLIKQSRLSVMPIDYKSWKKIYKMGNIN